METRKVKQVKLYCLVLNTFGSAESAELKALATSEEALKNWYELQKLEQPEIIDGWQFTFKKDSPLRGNNPLGKWQKCKEDIHGHGWFSEWCNENLVRNDVFHVDF